MTWEQAVSAVLAIGVTALARLVNQWLPPVFDKPLAEPGAEWADSEPMAGPAPDEQTPSSEPPTTP